MTYFIVTQNSFWCFSFLTGQTGCAKVLTAHPTGSDSNIGIRVNWKWDSTPPGCFSADKIRIEYTLFIRDQCRVIENPQPVVVFDENGSEESVSINGLLPYSTYKINYVLTNQGNTVYQGILPSTTTNMGKQTSLHYFCCCCCRCCSLKLFFIYFFKNILSIFLSIYLFIHFDCVQANQEFLKIFGMLSRLRPISSFPGPEFHVETNMLKSQSTLCVWERQRILVFSSTLPFLSMNYNAHLPIKILIRNISSRFNHMQMFLVNMTEVVTGLNHFMWRHWQSVSNIWISKEEHDVSQHSYGITIWIPKTKSSICTSTSH